MKEFIKGFVNGVINADGEQWFGLILLVFLSGLAFTGLFALNTDHQVRCNYLKMDHSSAVAVYRIKNDINWAEDTTAFASVDQKEVLEVFSTMKQCPVEEK